MLELELTYLNRMVNEFDWIYYETTEGIASATFKYTNITKVDASKINTDMFVSIPNRETFASNYNTPLVKDNYRNTKKEVNTTSFLFYKSNSVNYYNTEGVASRTVPDLLINQYYQSMTADKPNLLIDDVYISMFKVVIKDMWKYNQLWLYIHNKKLYKFDYMNLSHRYPPQTAVKEQLSLGSSVIKELQKDTEESIGKKTSKNDATYFTQEMSFRDSVDLGKLDYFMLHKNKNGLKYQEYINLYNYSSGKLFYNSYTNLFNTSYGHMGHFNDYILGYKTTDLDNKDYGENLYSSGSKGLQYLAYNYLGWKATFDMYKMYIVDVDKTHSFNVNINELRNIQPNIIEALIDEYNKNIIYNDILANYDDNMTIIQPADILARLNQDLIVNMRDSDAYTTEDIIINQRPGDVIFNKWQEILKAYIHACINKQVEIDKAYIEVMFNISINIDKAYNDINLVDALVINKAYVDAKLSETYNVIYKKSPIVEEYAKLIIPCLIDKDIVFPETITYARDYNLTELIEPSLEINPGVKSIYDIYNKHDIISVKKGAIGISYDLERVIYDIISKKARELDGAINGLYVNKPYNILNINEVTQVTSDYNYNLFYLDIVNLKKPILKLLVDQAPYWLPKNFKTSIDDDFFGLHLPDDKRDFMYDYYEEFLYKPMKTNKLKDNFIRADKNVIKDIDYTPYDQWLTKILKTMFHPQAFIPFIKSAIDIIYRSDYKFTSRDLRDIWDKAYEINFTVGNKEVAKFNKYLYAIPDKKTMWHKEFTSNLINDARDTYIERFSRRMMSKDVRDLMINSRDFEIFASKQGRKISLIKAYVTVDNLYNRPTSIEHTYKFYWDKTKETNKKKYITVYNDFTFWVDRNYKDAMYLDGVQTDKIYDKNIDIAESVQTYMTQDMDIISDKYYQTIGKLNVNEIYMEVYNQFIFKYTARPIDYFNELIPINLIKLIEMYQDETPVVTATRYANINEAIISDLKDKELIDANTASFLINKDKIKVFLPQYEKFLQDTIGRDIIIGKHYRINTNTSYNKFFESFTAGVDELILPCNDYDYSVFEKDLMDPITGKPRTQSTMIDANTFIAKRPTKHPLPEFKDLAKEFIAIDAPLLQHLIEIFYSIWQENIFKFGGMDMRDAVAKMLEYLELYVEFNIPEILQDQGKRVIRFMRWYGEFAIVSNAEYKITINYDDLKSEFHKGTLAIPNVCENMWINPNKYIMTNQILGKDGSVELILNNFNDSQVKFMNVLSGGYLEIYLNDELIDTVGISKRENCYDVPKLVQQLGEVDVDPNKFKILYKAVPNGAVSLANIIVTNYKFKDFSTEYSPKIGTGNMALNDMMKKISVMAELYDNNQVFIQQTINGNLAMTSLVDKLINYFNLHHANKQKGKRLTIKK